MSAGGCTGWETWAGKQPAAITAAAAKKERVVFMAAAFSNQQANAFRNPET
jgi:hypothetical protein